MQRVQSAYVMFGLAVAISGLLTIGTALGQEQPSPPPVSAVEDTPQGPEQTIYIPYERLKEVLGLHGASVFVPLQEYLEMWRQGRTGGMRPAPLPIGGVISAANYTGQIQQDQVTVKAVFNVQILKDGWVEIPVAFGDAAIGKVTAEPHPVLLRGTGNGTYALLFSKPGEQQVTLELTGRVRTAPEGRSFELMIPNVAITNFELTVPESDQTIELQPKLLQQVTAADPKSTQIRASVGSTDKISARWHPRVGTKPDMEVLASATAATLVSAEEGLLHADAFFTVDVLRGQLDQFRIAVPKGQRVLDVSSEARVKEWSVEEQEHRQIVHVTLLSRQSGRIPLEVHTEWVLGSEPFDVTGLEGETAYGIHLLDVLRESGQVALRTSSDLTLNVATQEGVARIDESEADARLKRPGAAYFKYYAVQCHLAATARPVQPRLVVDHRADVVIGNDQLRVNSTLIYTIERAGLFELQVGVPEGLTVEDVQCEGLKQYDLSTDQRLLTISLRESRLGQLAVAIKLVRPRDPAAQTEDFEVPLLEPRNVEVETGRVRLLAPESIEVLTNATGIVGFQPDPAAQTESTGNERLVSGWLFHRRPIALPAKTVLKPTRLSADIASRLDVQQGQIQVRSTVAYLVEYAGLDTFRIEVPAAAADSLQIQMADGNAPPIREKSAGPAVDGWVPWTIQLQRDALGTVPILVTYDLKLPAEVNQATVSASVDLIRALPPFTADDTATLRRNIPLSRITGEVSVEKDRALSVATTVTGSDVETIDVRELTLLPHEGFSAYRYYLQPVTVQAEVSRFEIQKVADTVISKGLVELVLDRGGAALLRGRYQLRSSERQRLRVDFPKGMEPLGAEIDGQSVALEKHPDAKPADGWEAYYVNVARTKASNEPFLFVVQYRITLTPIPFATRGGSLLTRMPVLGGTNAPVPVQQFRVVLWVPDEFALVGTPEHFETWSRPSWRELLWNGNSRHPDNPQDGWIGGSSGGVFDFPTEGQAYVYSNLGGRDRIQVQWWHLPFYTWIVSGALVVIAVILRNTTWENKLTLLIVAAFLAAAYALKDADLVIHGLAVAAYGIAAMVALWLVHGILSAGRTPGRGGNGAPPGTPPAAVIPPPGIFDSVTLGLPKS